MIIRTKARQWVRVILEIVINNFGATKLGILIYDLIIKKSMQNTKTVTYHDLKMHFIVPNRLTHFRVQTFATKEPETLEWVDQLPEGCVLWDIGANIGLYTVYAVLKRKCRVVAFEPSVFNLELLARNLYLNQIYDQVTLIPLALSDQIGSNLLRLTSTEWGGALSTFGKDLGWDGQAIREIFAFPTYGLSMDQAVDVLQLAPPAFIKMDVDGIEHFLLQGGVSILKQIQGILVEINDDFVEQADLSKRLLEEAGLVLLEKRRSALIENTTAGFENTNNQIWGRT